MLAVKAGCENILKLWNFSRDGEKRNVCVCGCGCGCGELKRKEAFSPMLTGASPEFSIFTQKHILSLTCHSLSVNTTRHFWKYIPNHFDERMTKTTF